MNSKKKNILRKHRKRVQRLKVIRREGLARAEALKGKRRRKVQDEQQQTAVG